MVEYLGLLYGIIKDIKEYFTYEESEKLIDQEYVDQLKMKHKDNGEDVDFRWSAEDKMEARKAKGWECYYQIDRSRKKKFVLKNKSGKILIAKPNKN